MDRLLVWIGSLLAVATVGIGVTQAAGDGAAPAGVAAAPRPPPPAPAAPAAPAVPEAPPVKPVASPEVDWATLTAYEYQADLKGLPDAVKALEGKTVVMRGFLMPLYEFDDIHEFVLVPNHMSCCFGMPAGINGQVQVKLTAKRGLPNTNEPLQVTGTFHAVETKEQGYLLSIWRIDDATARIVGY